MSRAWTIAALLLLAAVRASADDPAPPAMTWQDAIGTLAGERTRAEFCVTTLKRYGSADQAVIARGEAAYTAAKADIDGVIAGLSATLAQRDTPAAFAGLQAGLERGVAERTAFCKQATALAPTPAPGTKGPLTDVLVAVIGPLIDAAKTIYLEHRNEDALARATINTQLEATKWRDFSAIQP